MKSGSLVSALILSLICISQIHAQSSRRYPGEMKVRQRIDSIADELLTIRQEQEKFENSEAPGQEIDDKKKSQQVDASKVMNNRQIMDIKVSPYDSSAKRPKDRFAEFDVNSFARNRSAYPQRLVTWEAPNILYNPLYFEDVVLERYGQTYGPLGQPWVSAVRFLGSATALPYNALVDRPRSCATPLGYGRPGNCVPTQRQRIFLRK